MCSTSSRGFSPRTVASLKAIRRRIGSVRNTEQVTRAMKVVSAAKLRRAQAAVEGARPYAAKVTGMLGRLAAGQGGGDLHPFFEVGNAPAHLVVLTSDRGLCGGYNSSIVKLAENFARDRQGEEATLTGCGRRGNEQLRIRGVSVAVTLENRPLDLKLAREVVRDITGRFLSGEAGSVHLVYSRFLSAMSQEPVVEQLLPVEAGEETETETDYLYEPGAPVILESLLKRYIETRVFAAMLEATASEHGARMTAMDSASRNAAEMIDRLTLVMNRARQAGITTELMEIVGGAEALKG